MVTNKKCSKSKTLKTPRRKSTRDCKRSTKGAYDNEHFAECADLDCVEVNVPSGNKLVPLVTEEQTGEKIAHMEGMRYWKRNGPFLTLL